jgi:hypothetical protein
LRFLVTGRGTSGSWRVRGEQLGAAIGARVEPRAERTSGAEVAVVVKRLEWQIVERLHRARLPFVWDVVDAYPQPGSNCWPRDACIAWLQSEVKRAKPAAIVAATHAMAADCADLRLPVIALPHHARPGLKRNPIREAVRVVGYEGGEQYLGFWRQLLETECARRGWQFVVNPESLADLDIVVALREADGYAPRHWKSNVKLANAMGSGTPIVCCREAGYLEQAVGNAVKWADNARELGAAFDALTPHAERDRAARWLAAATPRLADVAARYRSWLETLSA